MRRRDSRENSDGECTHVKELVNVVEETADIQEHGESKNLREYRTDTLVVSRW